VVWRSVYVPLLLPVLVWMMKLKLGRCFHLRLFALPLSPLLPRGGWEYLSALTCCGGHGMVQRQDSKNSFCSLLPPLLPLLKLATRIINDYHYHRYHHQLSEWVVPMVGNRLHPQSHGFGGARGHQANGCQQSLLPSSPIWWGRPSINAFILVIVVVAIVVLLMVENHQKM